MNNLSHAVEIAMYVRNYLRECTELDPDQVREVKANYEKITKQIKNVSNIKGD